MIDVQERAHTRASWEDLYHTGPGTLAGRYLRTFWHPVLRAEDLPVGKAKPIRIMSQYLTVYRGEVEDRVIPTEGGNPYPPAGVTDSSAAPRNDTGGRPHVVDFRCAHRRTQLSIGWVEGDAIRCRYHGWAYDASGQCVEQPGEPEPFCNRIKIAGYPTEEYLGLIFAYLGEGDPPPLPRYPDFEGPGLLDVTTYVRNCNYGNNLDNDSLHTYFVHRFPRNDWRKWQGNPPRMSAKETAYGTKHFVAGQSEDAASVLEAARGMPNVSFRLASSDYSASHGGAPPTDVVAWRVPIDDESYLSLTVNLVHVRDEEERQRYIERRAQKAAMSGGPEEMERLAERVLAGELEYDGVDLPMDALVILQDHVTQQGQGAYYDRREEHLGSTDAEVILRRNVMMRELRALAEGRPLKQWAAPSRATMAGQ
ncbi:MAG: pobA 2 [Chloroflexi bacterium]|nr:pobA 2 [Chloroflexota bacterium]